MPDCVYTIGHSNHSMVKLVELLTAHHVDVVADVRSHPYSRFNPQFNRESLQGDLRLARLAYVFLGQELGGRSEDESCYVDGKVDYDRLALTSLFQEGLARLARGAHNQRIALLCAEKDPLTCHRAILVCRHLAIQGLSAMHILENGQTESQDEAIARLRAELGYPERDLFRSREEMNLEAYEHRGKQIAYSQRRSLEEQVVGGVLD